MFVNFVDELPKNFWVIEINKKLAIKISITEREEFVIEIIPLRSVTAMLFCRL